jgi:hypothetical protein
MKFRNLCLLLFFCCYSVYLFPQYSYGVTGLLHSPSAEMQQDKTVMIGGGFLNENLTPPRFNYNTYNYYLNVTIFPCLEIAYTCTLFKVTPQWGVQSQMGKFTNQDRYFSLRLRVLKEEQFFKYMPAAVLGTSDPFTESRGGEIMPSGDGGNGYFSRFYVAMTKHIPVNKEELGLHVSYLYNRRNDYHLNGIAGGITYSPSMLSDLKLIAEYDSHDILIGMNYLLFHHFLVQAMMQKGKYFSCGLTYLIHLK